MTLLGGKKTEDQAQQDELNEIFKTPAPPKGAFSPVKLILTFVIILLIGLIILVVYLKGAISAAQAADQLPTIFGSISTTASVLSKGVLQYNNSRSVIEFAKIHYSVYNSANTTAMMTVYASNPNRKIYLLNLENYCINCFVGSSLYLALNSSLTQYGLILNSSSLNYVDINNIDSIPKGSIIIIPSGLVPNILLPNVSNTNLCPKYTSSTIPSLLSEGDVILYVGRNFSRAVTCGGQTIQTPASSNLDALYNVTSFNTTHPSNILFMNNATFAFRFGQTYGNAAELNVGQNGSLIALSNFPSVGWSDNYTNLAQDIAKVLASRFWIPVIATGTANIPGAQHSSSNLTIFTTNLVIGNGPAITTLINSSYPLVRIFANNSAKFSQYDIPLSIKFRNNGEIGIPSSVGLGTQTQIAGEIYNSSGRVIDAYVQVYNINLTPVKGLTIQFGRMASNTKYDILPSFVLPSGYYFANLTDQNGDKYSSALFYISNANITSTNLNFKNGTFSFFIESNGAPVTDVPYSINLNGAYNSTGYVDDGVLVYNLPKGTAVSYGNKVFTINLLNNTYSPTYAYNNPGLKIPPFYIEVAIELIIIVVITKVLVPSNVEEYYIDVPDIRPIQKQILKENSDAMVDVFEKVNAYYRWRNMPLTVDEVKTGISNNIKYGNAKISVTARNTYTTLSKLVSKGLIEEAGDYYALTKWIKDSGHSIDYLVVYRKLRDFCVANAMLFTELDSNSNVDMIITNKSSQNFIKIYDDDMKMKDIEVKQGARMFIAFLNEEKKQLFLDKLYTSYGRNAELLKMAINYGNIKLIDTEHIEELKL